MDNISVFSKPSLPQAASLWGEAFHAAMFGDGFGGYADATDRGEDRTSSSL
jgi:hypothetical protein